MNRVVVVVENNTCRCENGNRSEKTEEKREDRVENPRR